MNPLLNKLIHSVQLWEKITRKKAPYTAENIDSGKVLTEKQWRWVKDMMKTIDEWNPEKHGYRRYRAKFIGNFFELVNSQRSAPAQ
jgi:hypothetical protein